MKNKRQLTKEPTRIFWADALKMLSIFMVVVIHSSAKVLYAWDEVLAGKISVDAWNFANILNSVSRISVPLFVMLSGAFLLNNTDSLQTFLKKRIPRILIPWIVWGTVQLLYNFNFSLSEILSGDFASKVAATYFGGFWFMPMILGLYLLTPIIREFTKTAKLKEFLYFFTLWFVTASLVPTLNQTFGINISLQLPIFLQYLGYYIAGYYFTHKLKISAWNLQLTRILFITSIAVIALGTYSLTLLQSSLHESLYLYTNAFVLTASLTGFLTFKDFFEKHPLFQSATIKQKITKISCASFGIFLSHALILDVLTKGKIGVTVHGLSMNPILALPITIILVFSMSLLLILILRRYLLKYIS